MFGNLRQFIIYRVVSSSTRPGKTDKFPVDYRTGCVASAHDSGIWLDEQTATIQAQLYGPDHGVGFVFTESDPYWFLDIDNCLIDGSWSPLAVQLATYLNGCAIEISRSGTGIHFFGRGIVPPHGCKNTALGLEFYHTGRFVALTGNAAMGSCDHDASSVLPAIIEAYFPPGELVGPSAPHDGPVPEWRGPSDDAELLRRAMQSQSAASAFGTKASFADLWLANEAVLSKAYPDLTRAWGESEADMALAQHLAFWTGKDAERIERLMRQSRLVRDKWDEHATYLRELTIAKAVGRQVDVLIDKETPPPVALGPRRENGGFCDTAKQIEVFAGCIYIRNQHRALVPTGVLMKPEQFKVTYGGYNFQLDDRNEKLTRDAWDAWTLNQINECVQVEGTCFKPQLPFAEIVTRDGQRLVNTYMPINVPRRLGDTSRILKHLEIILPNERDRAILLAYMAACIQYQGVKFQWAPLLQGVEGNGKTLFARCVAEAVGRRYTHWPKASKLAKEFNAWMVDKVFYAVEDIYVPDSRREVIEELKPMITGGDGLEIEAKGVDQVSGDICGNFMFNSNHKDAIRKTANDRRFCVLYTAQQQAEDLSRDGLTGDYFPKMYVWLREEGYAAMTDFLWNYAIPAEFNPAGDCQRAPMTTTTDEAISKSTGNVEQELAEAISEGLPGFAGGWVSSIWLDRMLKDMRLAHKVGRTKRREILEAMGYILHPALHEGRVNNIVTPDGGKPRLFILKTAMAAQITNSAEVAKSYEAANSGAVNAGAYRAFGSK